MSRTNRRGRTTSPIKKYLQFSGSTGTFRFYNKESKDRDELDKLKIIVLDVRSSVTGYNSTTKSQITSNMVAETGKEVLKVQSWEDGKPTVIAEGLYKDIKDKVKTVGGKFTTNVICLTDVGNGQEICNLQLQGSSLNGWINFLGSLDRGGEYNYEITIMKGDLSKLDGKGFAPVTKKEEDAFLAKIKKNPRTPQPIWFYTLAFETELLTDEQVEQATNEDEKLQSYFEGVSEDSSDSNTGTENEDAGGVNDFEDSDNNNNNNEVPF